MSAPIGGVQRYVQEVLRHLPGCVEVVAPGLAQRDFLGHAWEQVILPAQLRGRLLWSPSNTGPLAVARQVVTIHDMVPLDHPEWLSRRFAAWYRWLLPRLARRARRVIAVSGFTRERILAHCSVAPEKVVTIPHGVDARFCPRPQGEVAAMRRRLDLHGPYLLSVGGIGPRKNLAGLLAAWARVQGALDAEVVLAVAGADAPTRIFGERGGASAGGIARTRFLGQVEDCVLPALYSGALALVYPSLYEGFGWPPLEAMACGVPVVAGRGTGLEESVGGAALLVDPSDGGALADGIVAAAGDRALRADLRRRGLARAAQFSWERAAARTWEVLQAAAD